MVGEVSDEVGIKGKKKPRPVWLDRGGLVDVGSTLRRRDHDKLC